MSQKQIGGEPFPENKAVRTYEGMDQIYGPGKDNKAVLKPENIFAPMKETEQTLLDQIKNDVGRLHYGEPCVPGNQNRFNELDPAIQLELWPIVCECYAEAKAKPKWYSKQEMYDDLIRNNYSHQIAEELSERWAMDLENARNAGIEKGRYQVQASCEATLKKAADRFALLNTRKEITDPLNIVIL